MEPLSIIAATATITSGFVGASVALTGAAFKATRYIVKHRKIILSRFQELATHLKETLDGGMDDGEMPAYVAIVEEINKLKEAGALANDKRGDKGTDDVLFNVLHPATLVETLNDLTSLVGLYDADFMASHEQKNNMGMFAAVSGVSIIAGSTIDIVDIINTCINKVGRAGIKEVIGSILGEATPGEATIEAVNDTLSAFITFIGSLLRFETRVSKIEDTSSPVKMRNRAGVKTFFSMWPGSAVNSAAMVHTLKKLRDEIREFVASPDLGTASGKRKREAISTESTSSSSSSASLAVPPPYKLSKKARKN